MSFLAAVPYLAQEGITQCQEPIFHEIVHDLEAALEQFRLIANDLGGESSEKATA